MNAKTVKKIRRELNSKEKEMAETILNYFNSLPFIGRLKIALKIISKKL